MGVPDAAAQKGGILHQRLRKAVVTAPEDLAVAGLLHASPGKFLRVDHGAVVKALQQKDGLPQKRPGEDLVYLVFAVHLAEGDAPVDELLHIGRSPAQGRPLPQQKGGDALNDAVVPVSVNDVESALPCADVEIPADDVVIPPHAQQFVQLFLIFRKVFCQLLHKASRSIRFSGNSICGNKKSIQGIPAAGECRNVFKL